MKVIGNIIKQKARASSIIQMEMFTKGTGAIIKQMDSGNIPTNVVLATRAIGRKINSMVQELRIGRKAQDMKVNITCPRNKV